MSTTPPDTSQPHVDEVVESLERAFTLLKRRTRDVLKLAYEREELVAAIEGRAARSAATSSLLAPDTTVHGASVAAEPSHDERVDETTIPAPADIDAEHETMEPSPEPSAAGKWARPTMVDTSDALESIDEAPETSYDEITSAVGTAETEPDAVPADLGATVEAAHDLDEITDQDEQAVSAWDDGADESDDTAAPTAAWQSPDLEWSDDSAIESHVAPEEFPHPMPPVDPSIDASILAVDDDPEALDPAEDAWSDFASDDIASDVSAEASQEELDAEADSPFASEFTEHVEEVGGSLESSPFDLDTPPRPESYRPRSFKTDAAPSAETEASLADSEPSAPAGEGMEAAWDDFAGPPAESAHEGFEETPSDTAPAPASGGSRLRDLVAQAQQAERERASQEKSDFDLIREDSSVSRYDKNSAKLPTVGISSEELSSSVASLRSSFSGDKKSGPSSRGDDTTREDKKAEKRAAKEAAKAAKAEAKRNRRKS